VEEIAASAATAANGRPALTGVSAQADARREAPEQADFNRAASSKG